MEIVTRPRSRRWRRLAARLSLLAVVATLLLLLPSSLGLSQHVVTDRAMGGGFARGALALDRPVRTVGQIQVGDVVTFPEPGRPEVRLTRRVVSVDGSDVLTRGDALTAPDPWVLRVGEQELARSVLAVPWVGFPELLLPWLSGPALVALVALAALGSAVAAHREAGRRARARPPHADRVAVAVA